MAKMLTVADDIIIQIQTPGGYAVEAIPRAIPSSASGPPWTWIKVVDPGSTAATNDGSVNAPFLAMQDPVAAAVTAGEPGCGVMVVSPVGATGAQDVAVPPAFLYECTGVTGPVGINNLSVGAGASVILNAVRVAGNAIFGAGAVLQATDWLAANPITCTGPAQLRFGASVPSSCVIGDIVNPGGDVDALGCDAAGAYSCDNLRVQGGSVAFGTSAIAASLDFRGVHVGPNEVGTVTTTGATVAFRGCTFDGVVAFDNDPTIPFVLDAASWASFQASGSTLTNPLAVSVEDAPPQSLYFFADASQIATSFLNPGTPGAGAVAGGEFTILVQVPKGVRKCKSLVLKSMNDGVTGDVTFVVRKGGLGASSMADTAMTATIFGGQQDGSDVAHPFDCGDGDLVSLVTTAYTAAAGNYVCAQLNFE